MTRDYRKQYEWRKVNTYYVGLTLNGRTDADIIEYIDSKSEKGESKQGVVKRCIRRAMELEDEKEAREKIEEIEEKAAEQAGLDAEILRGK